MSDSESPRTACSEALGLPELLALIAAQVDERIDSGMQMHERPSCPESRSEHDLYNACLVNRAFNASFTRQLYQQLQWRFKNYAYLLDDDKRRRMLESGKAAHTRSFSICPDVVMDGRFDLICQYDWVRSKDIWVKRRPGEVLRRHETTLMLSVPDVVFSAEDHIYMKINRAIIDYCRHAVQLRRFSCANVLLSHSCVHALSRLPMLESVRFKHPNHTRRFLDITWRAPGSRQQVYMDRRVRYGHLSKSLEFSNLKELVVHNIPYGLDTWVEGILRVAIKSPELKVLGLQLAPRYYSILRWPNSPGQAPFPEGDDEYADNGEAHNDLDSEGWIKRRYHEETGRELEAKMV